MSILDEIVQYRGNPSTGFNPLSWITYADGVPVEILIAEPDPLTFKQNYYYNSRINILFKKVFANGPKSSHYIWKRVSQ